MGGARMTTLNQLQRRLADAHTRIGGEGRFSFTVNQGARPECFITHWLPPGPTGYGDCRTVGVGTADDCLKSLDRYVEGYVRKPTAEEVGRMIGVLPAPSEATRPEATKREVPMAAE